MCDCNEEMMMPKTIKIGERVPLLMEPVFAYQAGQRDFQKITLHDEFGGGLNDEEKPWVVLFFYPRDFTFICPTELKGFSNAEKEFTALNAKVFACSTDSEWSHKAWFERDLPEVKYPILADTNHGISKAFGVLNESDGSSERGLFIIDTRGIVQYILVSAGSVGRSVKETLRVLEALQSGELCPMEWKQGEKTLGKA